MAALERSVLQRQCLRRRRADRETMEREAVAWAGRRHAAGSAVEWRFTTADAPTRLRRLSPAIEL